MYLFTICLLAFTATVITASEKPLTVHVTTWNVNEKNPPAIMSQLLGQTLEQTPEERPDIIIVGLQEVTMSPMAAVKNYFYGDKWSHTMEKYLNGTNYSRVKTGSLLGTVLNIYVKLDHAWTKDKVAMERAMTGKGGFSPNKGGVIMSFRLYGQNFCIINSHFHAHDHELPKRITDYSRIDEMRGMVCNKTSDYIFWLGDMNFRITEDPKLTAEDILAKINKGEHTDLLAKDQLLVAKAANKIFNNYNEQPITFKPTFKLVPDTGSYNLIRRPAWTDRILYKSESKKQITPLYYKSLEQYHQSDHYPVQAQFKIVVDTNKY